MINVQISWAAVSALSAAGAAIAGFLHWSIRAIVREEIDKLDERYVGMKAFQAHVETLERRHGW